MSQPSVPQVGLRTSTVAILLAGMLVTAAVRGFLAMGSWTAIAPVFGMFNIEALWSLPEGWNLPDLVSDCLRRDRLRTRRPAIRPASGQATTHGPRVALADGGRRGRVSRLLRHRPGLATVDMGRGRLVVSHRHRDRDPVHLLDRRCRLPSNGTSPRGVVRPAGDRHRGWFRWVSDAGTTRPDGATSTGPCGRPARRPAARRWARRCLGAGRWVASAVPWAHRRWPGERDR